MDFRIGTPSQYSKSKMVAEKAPDSIPPRSYFLTMKDGPQLVGSLIAKRYNDSYVIRLVEVLGEFRGMGFGTKMMNEIIQFLKPKKLPILLYVDPFNKPAISVYTKLGFKKVKEGTAFGDKYALT
jgi:ribosomal protein S18 acetylase RimI-like enzyme